jgi:hypothetical protein
MQVSKQKWLGRLADTRAARSKRWMPLKGRWASKLMDPTGQAAPSDAAEFPTARRFGESGYESGAFGFQLSRE